MRSAALVAAVLTTFSVLSAGCGDGIGDVAAGAVDAAIQVVSVPACTERPEAPTRNGNFGLSNLNDI
jgi:hypothetical protein